MYVGIYSYLSICLHKTMYIGEYASIKVGLHGDRVIC